MASKRQASERRRRRTEALERPQYGWIWKPLLAALVIYLLVALGLGLWWSRTPPLEAPQGEAGAEAAPGVATVAGLEGLVGTLLDKPGGYLRNDLAPPGLWLDNMPAWELGVLGQARGLSRALPALAGGEAAAVATAAEALRGDADDWVYPATERRLERARRALDGYREALAAGGTDFAASPQGTAAWLEGVARRLDALGRRLSASVGDPRALAGFDVEEAAQETPWYRLDNVFFEARGETWALHRLLAAVERDQAGVLAATGLATRWEALAAELELSQRRLWSPVVLNGSGFGLFANHSLVMAHHVLRARDLARELAAGLAAAPAPEPADRVPAAAESMASGPAAHDEAATTEPSAPEERDEQAPVGQVEEEAAVAAPQEGGGDAAAQADAEVAGEEGETPAAAEEAGQDGESAPADEAETEPAPGAEEAEALAVPESDGDAHNAGGDAEPTTAH